MKRIALFFVAVLSVCATSFAAGNQPTQKSSAKQWEGQIYVENLSKCLRLTLHQEEKVNIICEYFNDQMLRANRSSKYKEKYLRQAVYGNLKLMKATLDKKQYAEYARLLNLTLQNKGVEIK